MQNEGTQSLYLIRRKSDRAIFTTTSRFVDDGVYIGSSGQPKTYKSQRHASQKADALTAVGSFRGPDQDCEVIELPPGYMLDENNNSVPNSESEMYHGEDEPRQQGTGV